MKYLHFACGCVLTYTQGDLTMSVAKNCTEHQGEDAAFELAPEGEPLFYQVEAPAGELLLDLG